VVVAPFTAEKRLVLVRQERVPVRDTIWEVPAGQVDQLCSSGSFKDVAEREMQEETGYELAPGGEFTFLGDFLSSAGFTDERAFLFLASPVRKSGRGAAHEASEAIIACEEFELPEIKRMIAEGEIRDANTLSIFARLVARDEIQFNAGSPG
jgi:ADP-ribose pyrophosphatase